MEKMLDLFKAKAFKDLMDGGLEIEARPRQGFDYFVEIDGEKFDAADLLETLENVESGDVYITNQRMGKMLLKFGILHSLGSSRWYQGASKGDNFKEFYDFLVEKLDNAE